MTDSLIGSVLCSWIVLGTFELIFCELAFFFPKLFSCCLLLLSSRNQILPHILWKQWCLTNRTQAISSAEVLARIALCVLGKFSVLSVVLCLFKGSHHRLNIASPAWLGRPWHSGHTPGNEGHRGAEASSHLPLASFWSWRCEASQDCQHLVAPDCPWFLVSFGSFG